MSTVPLYEALNANRAGVLIETRNLAMILQDRPKPLSAEVVAKLGGHLHAVLDAMEREVVLSRDLHSLLTRTVAALAVVQWGTRGACQFCGNPASAGHHPECSVGTTIAAAAAAGIAVPIV